jgi:hypothetical protein
VRSNSLLVQPQPGIVGQPMNGDDYQDNPAVSQQKPVHREGRLQFHEAAVGHSYDYVDT